MPRGGFRQRTASTQALVDFVNALRAVLDFEPLYDIGVRPRGLEAEMRRFWRPSYSERPAQTRRVGGI